MPSSSLRLRQAQSNPVKPSQTPSPVATLEQPTAPKGGYRHLIADKKMNPPTPCRADVRRRRVHAHTLLSNTPLPSTPILQPSTASRPQLPVQRPELNRFGNVVACDFF